MTGPAHVLIVDDDDDLRELLIAAVRCRGLLATAAAHGEAALRALATASTIGLIVLDLDMPVMDGRTFLAHKARSAHAAIPVILFTSSPSLDLGRPPDVIAAVSKGAGIEALLAEISAIGGLHVRDESGS